MVGRSFGLFCELPVAVAQKRSVKRECEDENPETDGRISVSLPVLSLNLRQSARNNGNQYPY